MLTRFTRIVGSLAAVISTYVVYSFTVAALVEPPAVAGPSGVGAGSPPGQIQVGERGRLARFFAATDWERTNNPIVVETQQGIMLLERYEHRADGGVLLEPFSMVLLPTDRSGDEALRDRRAVVLRAPEGAVLRFDERIDLKRGKIGKLIGGELLGKITIHSQQRSPGPEDDLRIVASELKLTEQQIWTLKPVKFRLGPNHGSGRHLRIALLKDPNVQGKQRGPSIGGVKSFELVHDVSMRLEPDTVDLGLDEKLTPPDQDASTTKPEPPVEITCLGPFRFDLDKYVATFRERVNVVRLHPEGPSDDVSCELLSVFFEPSDDSDKSAKTDKHGVPKLVPRRIEAIGSPVVVRAPSEKVEARGQFLRYDLITGGGTVWVSDQSLQDAWVRREGDMLRGRQLYFEAEEEDRRWGLFEAQGAGSLTGALPDEPGQTMTAHWSGRAKFRPLDGYLVASLEGATDENGRGRVQFNLPGEGRVEAEEIHIWLEEPPEGIKGPDGKTPPLKPDRLLAMGNVIIDSQQLTGAVGTVEVWFDKPAQVGEPLPTEPPAATESQPQQAAPANATVASTTGVADAKPAEEPRERFDVSGQRLRLRVLLAEERPEVTEVIVERDVRLVQTQLARPEDKPLLVTGDHVHLVQPTPETATVAVTGTDEQPAHVEAQGLTLDGQAINLDRGANRMWIDSPGVMTYPIDRDLDGRPLAVSRPLRITWQERMEFDGRTAVFHRAVEAIDSQQLLRTDRLEVTLAKKIDFSQQDQEDRPEVEDLACVGQVYLERYAYENGRLDSVQRMQAHDLTLNQRTGLLAAAGPGWVKTVRVDTGDPFQTLSGGSAPAARVRPAAAGNDQERLSYLGVDFEDRLVGNVNEHQRQMTFYGRVRSTSGDVDDWTDELSGDDLRALGARGATLSCHELTVAEGGRDADGKTQVELTAGGNIRVEGTLFTALANRLTYTQAKDLLVLEGDGRAPAELYYRKQPGAAAEKAFARKISYWRSKGYAEAEQATHVNLNLSQLPRFDKPAATPGTRP